MGERVATNYIEKMGLTVVDTNYRTRLGEIDIIAKRDLVYHFIEIKARRGMQHGLAREAVTKKKQKHIKRTAMLFLYDLNQKKRRWKEISFDVIEVYLHEDFQSSIHYLPQCF
ncbi:MAG: YraN family protein [Veillonella parvula]